MVVTVMVTTIIWLRILMEPLSGSLQNGMALLPGAHVSPPFTLDQCTPALCGDPTGLNSSALTFTTATVGWTAVASAISYDVDYKATSSATWINAVTGGTSTSVALSGLTQGTQYDWRVRATCAAGSGNYVQAQFTTTAPCNAPTGLTNSSITSSSAVSWLDTS